MSTVPISGPHRWKAPSRPAVERALQLELFPHVASEDKQQLSDKPEVSGDDHPEALAEIAALDAELWQHFQGSFVTETALTRELVSFQANKRRPRYRWYKFKEAFSASLVEYLLWRYGILSGTLLDPFAGMGTALFVASAAGMDADGIEVLPIGQQIIKTRVRFDSELTQEHFAALRRWLTDKPWHEPGPTRRLSKLRITDGAYPPKTTEAIEHYLAAAERENELVRDLLRFALLCVLESVSYTRKDGQYLRWDHRAGRRQGAKPFNKGTIAGFDEAICGKLGEILLDSHPGSLRAGLFAGDQVRGRIRLFAGSCLDVMPTLPNASYDAILTSPPYCNRYDYTRTYALELAVLGVGEREIADLRQRMVSCTVENRPKDLVGMNPEWSAAVEAADRHELLKAILRHLEREKAQGRLNNNGIPRMVRGYFYEMACVIAECARLLRPNAPLFMVNDNVRYAGASLSVDMILSRIAETLGFRVENILVLPKGKGNSSQQMGEHGRDMLRKCVYVWRR
jgi:hypothetical protein